MPLREIDRKKPELLIPASSLEVLKTAVLYGADAVYIGGEAFSLRAKAKNFSMEEMAEGIAFAHKKGVKVYVTANILAHNGDLTEAREYFAQLRDLTYVPANQDHVAGQASAAASDTAAGQVSAAARPDALIISDPGMFTIAKEVWPEAEIHISTQANNTNYETYLFWHRLGAKRVVSARELSLKEIREIRDHIPEDMEIESFIHGSMCISYSGRCLLSNYFTGRDANQGNCTHPCRWKYAVMEESRPGEYLPVYENERGTFLFNSKDLCMIEYVPELVQAGIDSFKIEGRMKTALYVAAVTRTYRKAIDDYFISEETYRANMDWYRAEIAKCTYRQYSTGFYFGKPSEENQIYDNSTYVSEYIYLGIVEENIFSLMDLTRDYADGKNLPWIEHHLGQGKLHWHDSETGEVVTADNDAVETLTFAGNDGNEGERTADGRQLCGMLNFQQLTQRNKFSVGDHIEVMKPDGTDVPVLVGAIYDENFEPQESAPHAKQKIWVWLIDDKDFSEIRVNQGDVLRVKA